MTDDEKKSLEVIEGGLEVLRLAVNNGDPKRELDLRVRDLLVDVRAVSNGMASTVKGFGYAY